MEATTRTLLRPRRVLVVAAVSVIIAATAAGAGIATNATNASTAGWSLNGAAQTVPSGIQLTQAGHLAQAGSAFWSVPLDLATPISIGFDATMNGGLTGADGIAVVFGDASKGVNDRALGESGSAIGFGGIPGVAVALDTFQNANEPSNNFVGIADGMTLDGTPDYVTTTTAVPDLRAGTHHFRIDASPNHVNVTVDGHWIRSTDIALPPLLYLGFTGANGAFTDNHTITDIEATNIAGIPDIAPPGDTPPSTPTTSPPATFPPVTSPPATSPPVTVPPASCSGVAMPNGQADIDAAPSGTTFCLSGTHNWSLTPKTGDRFIGPAVLDGGGVTKFAFQPGVASGVLLSTLEIRNYVPGYQFAAIMTNGSSAGWTLQNLQVHDNGDSSGGAGATLGPNWQVLGGRYFNNRQKGLTDALGNGATVNDVEIDHNNFTDDSYSAPTISCGDDAGGFKWVANDVTVENSSVHDNACVGLWTDINASGATIANNRVYDNWDEGILVEISHDATVTGNTVSGNGFRSFRGTCANLWLYGGGITLASSANVTVAGNTVSANCNGITGTQENRPDGNPGLLENVSVRDNTVSGPGGKTGTGAFPASIANLATRNITFADNTFINGMNGCGLLC